MLIYLRYALATICFAASAGSLALWGWSYSLEVPAALLHWSSSTKQRIVFALDGMAVVVEERRGARLTEAFVEWMVRDAKRGMFGRRGPVAFAPLWYPALIFAFAGIASLRLGRRFTLRSAIIATSVVAGLLGLAVAL